MKKITIITGASRGIGAGIAFALAKAGWSVVINYRGNKQAAENATEKIRKLGRECLLVQADISNNSDRQNLLDQTIQKFGQIDLLINNAGMAPRQRLDILETTEESYDQVMSVNLKGPFFLSQLIANKMLDLIQSKS